MRRRRLEAGRPRVDPGPCRQPIFRQRVYEAASAETACRLALADGDPDWDDERSDTDTPGETYVSALWEGDVLVAHARRSVPQRFAEAVLCKAALFDALLTLLKEPRRPMRLLGHDFEA